MTPETITSLQNPRVKNAIKLRDRGRREQQGQFLIEGVRELERAIEAGVAVEEVFVCEPHCRDAKSGQFVERLLAAAARIFFVSSAVFEKLAFGHRAEGLLAVATTPRIALADLRLPDRPLVAVLEGVEKPGNAGAVLRSADAAGISALILADAGTDIYNPNTIRASLGAVFAIPVCHAGSAETLDWLRARDLQIVAAKVDGNVAYTEIDWSRPTAVVLGSEAKGLSPVWAGPAVKSIKLPMRGRVDSLNVSATAAVLFYEALRQRSRSDSTH